MRAPGVGEPRRDNVLPEREAHDAAEIAAVGAHCQSGGTSRSPIISASPMRSAPPEWLRTSASATGDEIGAVQSTSMRHIHLPRPFNGAQQQQREQSAREGGP